MKQLIKLMINCAATCICVSAFGYSNPIEGGTTEFVTDQWDVSVPWFYVGSNSSSNMLYVSNGGQVNNQIGVMGNNSSSSGNIGFVSGSNAVWNSALELSVGNLGSDNTLGIFNGGRVNTANAYIGNASSNNFVGISGAGSELSANTLHVGHTGADNSMGILDGGTVSSEQASLGHWIGSDDNSVLVMGTNSLWNNTGSLNIGEHGSENTLIIMDDGAVQSPVVNLGVHSYSSNNTLSVFGENAHLDASELNIGGTATTVGGIGNRVSVSDGGTIVTTDLLIHDGNSLDVNDGGTFSINTNFNLVVSGVNFNEGGTLEVGGRLNGISDAIDGRRTVVLSGEDAVWNATLEQFPPNPTARLSVGKDTAGNALVLRDGATATAFNVEVGGSAGSSNNVLQILGPSVFENVAEWRVGDQGSNNEVTLADGGRLEATTMYVGAEQAAAGNVLTVLGTNSMAQISYEMYVGYRGSNNRMDVLDGGTAEALAMNVGGEYGASNNVLTVSGAGSSVESTWLSVGGYQSQGGDGNHMLISEGGRVENEKGSIGRTAGADDNSVLVTGNGSAWNNSEGLYLGGYRSGANWIDGGTGNSLTVKDGGLVLVGDVNTNNLSIIGSGGGIVVGDASGTPEMIVANGSMVESMQGYIGFGADESGSVVVSGSGSVWSNSGSLVVGLYGSDNTMTIADGGLVQSASSSIGGLDNANGNQVVVTDAGSRWDAGWLDVGSHGFGNTLIITNGGAVTSERGSVGRQGNGNTAIVTGADSVWTNNHFLIVGDNGSDNALHILDGATVQSAFVGITSPGLNQSLPAGSNNMVRISGPGSTLIIAGETPYGGTADGVLDMGNGLLRIENGGAVHSAVAGIGGKVIVDGSGSVWSNSLNASIVDLTVSDGGAAFAGSARTVGNITIEGDGSEWVVSNSLSLASSATVRDGGQINAGTATIGRGGMTTVTGAGSALNVENALTIGDYYGGNTLLIENGGAVESAGGNIGYGEASSSNSVMVTGVGSVWNNAVYGAPSYTYSDPLDSDSLYDDPVFGPQGDLSVGYAGSGNRLVIEYGGRVESLGSNIGYDEKATDNSVVVSGEGSVWENRGQLNVGYNGSGNTLQVEDGGSVITQPGISIGYAERANSNRVVVSGEGSSLRSGWYMPGILPPGTIDGPVLTNLPPTIIRPPYTTFAGEGAVISGSGGLTIGNAGSGNTLTVADGTFMGGNSYIGGATSNNSVLVSGGGSVWSNTNGLVISDGTFTGGEGGIVSNVVIMPPVQSPNPVLIMNRLGELAVGRGGSRNRLLIADGAQVYSMGGVIGQQSNAWNNAVSVVGTNSAWTSGDDLYIGGSIGLIHSLPGDLMGGIYGWVDGGRGNSLYVGEGGMVNIGRDLQNRNYSSINIDPGASIHVASNYYQDATSSLRFGVETNAAGAPVNALVNVGGTAEFEEGARIEYASNVGQLQFDTVYTNKIIAADKLIVAGVEDADSLDLEMLDASGTLVDVIFWENDADIYGLVGRRHLADSAGFASNSMMAALSAEIDDMSLLGDSGANRMVNLLNTMSGSQQAAQLEQQYSRGVPAYQHSRGMTEGLNEIKKHTASKNQTRQSEPAGAKGPYRADQELQGWIKPYGLWADHAAQDGFSGYDQSVYGTVVGLDLPLQTALVGVAGGYGQSKLSQDDGDESTARTGYGVIYVNGGTDAWFFDVNMGFGRSSIEQESGAEFDNSADYDASNFALQFGGGKEMEINRSWAFTPKASALWTYYYQEAYTETSSQGVGRMVDAYERNSLLTRLGAAVSWRKELKKMTLKPEARLYWLHEFNDDEGQVDYELTNGLGGEYHFLMAAPESDVLEAGLGITCIFNDDLQLVLDVDGRFGEDYSAYALSGRAVIEF